MDLFVRVNMTSHQHLIMGSQGDKLEHIMRDIKRRTSIELKQLINSNPKESRKEWILEQMTRAGIQNPHNKKFQLWQQDSHPIELVTLEVTWQKLNYVHYNPVLAGFTDLPENYLYSSARDYSTNRKGLIEIKRLDPMTVVVR